MRPSAPPLHPNPSASNLYAQSLPGPTNVALMNAIQYASQAELPALVDRAMQMGAVLNCPERYECNALVIAARANRPWAIGTLMARGAEVPVTPPDGVDLLMEACRNNHAAMAEALLEVAKMSIHAKDGSGKTALHHAVIAESAAIVTLLLEAGADPDSVLNHVATEEFTSIFGHNPVLSGPAVTPLMIATGLGNDDIVEALLDANADPCAGACSPLIIAACTHRQSIFDTLLASGADLDKCRNATGQRGLAACVAAHMPVTCLCKLVSKHDFTDDDGTINSPLGMALLNKDTNVVALLLASGAPIEDHEQSDEPMTLWDLALPQGKMVFALSDLLTSRDPIIIDLRDTDKFSILLQQVVASVNNMPAIACKGLFTSLLLRSFDYLQQLSARAPSLARSQCALAAAWKLQHALPEPANVLQKAPAHVSSPDKVWLDKMSLQIRRQREVLLEGSTRLVEHGMQALANATTLNFFLDCAANCPEHESMSSVIKLRITTQSGAPDAVVRLVRDAWINAAKWTKDWEVAPDADEEGNRFLQALAQNLMRRDLEEFVGDRDELTDQCLDALRQALPRESHALSKFCSDPVVWLRKFENRSNLDSPDQLLANQLQIELGLPLTTCEAIVSVWQQALETARDARWSTPGQLQALLKERVALGMVGPLLVANKHRVVPASANIELQTWRMQVLSARSATTGARKRPALAEALDAPARKEPRTSETG